MNKLHWSVDYSYSSKLSRTKQIQENFQEEFKKILGGSLSSSPIDFNAKRKTHRYTLLPNFWSGFKSGEDTNLNIGQVSIERQRDEGEIWRYKIEHENTSSGEALSLNFYCDSKPARPLVDSWQIFTKNSADGSYNSLSLTGEWNEQINGVRSVKMTTANGLVIVAGSIKHNETLTCNWAIFDILPLLRESISMDRLAILDDLEVLKKDCYIKPLEAWVFENGNEKYTFTGFCVFGKGLPPTYWWLTENGEVAVMSTMLTTYVLNGRSS